MKNNGKIFGQKKQNGNMPKNMCPLLKTHQINATIYILIQLTQKIDELINVKLYNSY
jgi:hypothetical protein